MYFFEAHLHRPKATRGLQAECARPGSCHSCAATTSRARQAETAKKQICLPLAELVASIEGECGVLPRSRIALFAKLLAFTIEIAVGPRCCAVPFDARMHHASRVGGMPPHMIDYCAYHAELSAVSLGKLVGKSAIASSESSLQLLACVWGAATDLPVPRD